MKIFIVGLTSRGKSYQARTIAEHFGLKHNSGSEPVLQRFGKEDNSIDNFWLQEKGREFERRRNKVSIDRDVDLELLEKGKCLDNIIVDSWTPPWLYRGHDAICIYLIDTASDQPSPDIFSCRHP